MYIEYKKDILKFKLLFCLEFFNELSVLKVKRVIIFVIALKTPKNSNYVYGYFFTMHHIDKLDSDYRPSSDNIDLIYMWFPKKHENI